MYWKMFPFRNIEFNFWFYKLTICKIFFVTLIIFATIASYKMKVRSGLTSCSEGFQYLLRYPYTLKLSPLVSRDCRIIHPLFMLREEIYLSHMPKVPMPTEKHLLR